jgi:hypothetical protein
MKFETSFPLSGNGTDFREFGYTGSSDDISGCWIAVTICVTGTRPNIIERRALVYINDRVLTYYCLPQNLCNPVSMIEMQM